MTHKKLSRNGIGTKFSRPVNLQASRDGFLRDWIFYEMSRKVREWEKNDFFDFSPIKHKDFWRWRFKLRWWWFKIRRWRLQLQRWRFELWWCFDLVFTFYYTQLWIDLLQCGISCLSWLILFSVLWNGVFLKLNLVTMIWFRRKVSCISCHLYNLTKWFTNFFFEIQRITKRDSLMKIYITWAKLLQRQQLNQIQI